MEGKLKRTLMVGAAIAALAGGGAAIAGAAGGDDEGGPDDGSGQPVTGSALDRAGAAALAETGGGQVTDSEVGDEDGYYEIEVTRDDGSQVDVHLDRDFNLINAESDGGEDD